MICAADRGLTYGDGVFRTLAVRSSVPQAWERHYQKLLHDCTALALACPPKALLHDELARVVRSARDCAVKIIVTRGAGERGYAPPAPAAPTRIVMSAKMPRPPGEYIARGVNVRVCTIRLAPQPALAGIKHLNRLENVLARSEWTDPTIAEGIMLSSAGKVICGTMSNLFIVEDGALFTPALSDCGVAGVTRDRVRSTAARHGVTCDEGEIDLERVLRADAVLLVNSLIGVWQVATLGSHTWQAHAVTERVRAWLEHSDD